MKEDENIMHGTGVAALRRILSVVSVDHDVGCTQKSITYLAIFEAFSKDPFRRISSHTHHGKKNPHTNIDTELNAQ